MNSITGKTSFIRKNAFVDRKWKMKLKHKKKKLENWLDSCYNMPSFNAANQNWMRECILESGIDQIHIFCTYSILIKMNSIDIPEFSGKSSNCWVELLSLTGKSFLNIFTENLEIHFVVWFVVVYVCVYALKFYLFVMCTKKFRSG